MYHNSKRLSIYFLQHSDDQIAPQISFHEANAQNLGSDKFKDNSYDLYTIAFGIRNCTSIPVVLKEAHRVLKPGGTFACLEFSRVNNPLLSMFA
jgi:ubiquinone/menaquinone biosynthesis C-methylase UbiE